MEDRSMKRVILVVPILALAVAGSSACATKKFVRTQVGEVNSKVETVSQSLEETQERTRQNEQAIAEANKRIATVDQKVDQKTDAVAKAAADAKSTAVAADSTAKAADSFNRKLVYEVVLSEDQGNFKVGQAMLPDAAKTTLDALVNKLKTNPTPVYFEIAGYTDSTGSQEYNEKLGLDRAQSVERYLHEQCQIPLHKISVISYGAENPVAPNTTRDGRAKNRRVVIKVLG
jgi:peptidoglycan-associated lipoprotein